MEKKQDDGILSSKKRMIKLVIYKEYQDIYNMLVTTFS